MHSGQQPAASEPSREGRVARSWRLSKQTWQIVRGDPAVLTLAVVSTLLTGAVLVVTYDLAGVFSAHGGARDARLALVSLILAYPLTFLAVFFNTAIAAGVSAALEGRRLPLRAALAVPVARLGQVALWSALASFVGVLIEQIASRLPFFGSLAVRLFGIGWSLASMFAVPILATQGCSAPTCLKRSAALVRERWGEGISGNIIITAWMLLVFIPAGVALGIGLAATRGSTAARTGVFAAWIVVLVVIVAAGAVLRQAFGVVLYRYAVGGGTSGFAASDLGAPFGAGRAGGSVEAGRRRAVSRSAIYTWVACALLAAAPVVLLELHKHHWSRHTGARILTPIVLWLALTAIVRAVVFLLAGLRRVLRS